MPKPKIQIDSAVVLDMYRNQKISVNHIADKLKCAVWTVISRLKEQGYGNLKPKKKPGFILEDVKRMYLEESKDMPEIAEYFKCSRSAVRKYIFRSGFLKEQPFIRKEAKRVKIGAEELRDLVVADGLTDKEIGARFDVCSGTIGNWRRRHNIIREVQPNSAQLDEAKLRKLFMDESISMKEIGKKLGVAGNTVKSYLVKFGMDASRENYSAMRSIRNGVKRTPTSKDGYVRIFTNEHPARTQGNYVSQHRLVVEEFINRLVVKGEIIHHINTIRHDNRLENLALLSPSMHSRIHRYMEKVCAYKCGFLDDKPPAIKFVLPTLWAGKFVDYLDLTEYEKSRKAETKKEIV